MFRNNGCPRFVPRCFAQSPTFAGVSCPTLNQPNNQSCQSKNNTQSYQSRPLNFRLQLAFPVAISLLHAFFELSNTIFKRHILLGRDVDTKPL